MRTGEASLLLNLVQPEHRFDRRLAWRLQLLAVIRLADARLLETDYATALNAPLAHWRKTEHFSAASFAHRGHEYSHPEAQEHEGLY